MYVPSLAIHRVRLQGTVQYMPYKSKTKVFYAVLYGQKFSLLYRITVYNI